VTESYLDGMNQADPGAGVRTRSVRLRSIWPVRTTTSRTPRSSV